MRINVDFWAIVAYLSGPQLTTTALAFGDAWPTHAKQIVAVAGGIVFSAGLIARARRNKTPPAGYVPALMPATDNPATPQSTQFITTAAAVKASTP